MPLTHREQCAKGAKMAGRQSWERGPLKCAIHGLPFVVDQVHEYGCLVNPCDCLPTTRQVCQQCEGKPDA